MNFMRKKPNTPLDELTHIYDDTANATIYNLGLEQNHQYKKALQAWKALHTNILFKMDMLEKQFPKYTYSADELSLKQGIIELDIKAQSHLNRVNRLFEESKKADAASSGSNQGSNQGSRSNTLTSAKSASYVAPTLRNGTHQSFTSKQHQHQLNQPRLLKTLRSDKSSSSLKFSPVSRPSEISKLAATQTFSHSTASTPGAAPGAATGAKHQLWAPSKSLNSQSHKAYNEEESILDKFDSDFIDLTDNNLIEIDSQSENDNDNETDDISNDNEHFDIKDIKRNEAYSRLEAIGNMSKISRSKTASENQAASSSNVARLQKKLGGSTTSKSVPNLLFPGTTASNAAPHAALSPPPLPPSPAPAAPAPAAGTASSSASRSRSVTPTSASRLKQPSNTTSKLKQNSSVKPATAKTTSTPASSSTALKPTIKSKISQNSINPQRKALPHYKKIPTIPPTQMQNPGTAKKSLKPAGASSSAGSAAKPRSKQNTPSPQPQKRQPAQPAQPAQQAQQTKSDDSMDESEEDESKLSEKEIRSKMEDQIISEIRGIDYQAAKQIFNEIVVRGDEVHWDDIAGLETAKNSLKETVVYPFLRPDLFSGLREPARGMLLFGPPGTGKTMLARAVATESKSTFFSISASSLTSKFLGESEKLVRALFLLARKLSPSIIFVDEIDSLLSARNENGEHESSRRIKNEFLIQWSELTHAAAGKDHGEDLQRVLVLAATNLPWSIDEAARRRFVRRQYIPLPEFETRKAQIIKLLAHQKHSLNNEDELNKLVEMTEGYSGSDITALAKDAAMGPLRSLGDKLLSTTRDEIRPIQLIDFEKSLKFIKPSVSKENLSEFEDWAAKFGSSGV